MSGGELVYISDAAVVGETTASSVAGRSFVRGALNRVDIDGLRMHALLDEQFIHKPSLLGRQLVQGLPAFTQAHPLQEPVLLHLQHGITLKGGPRLPA